MPASIFLFSSLFNLSAQVRHISSRVRSTGGWRAAIWRSKRVILVPSAKTGWCVRKCSRTLRRRRITRTRGSTISITRTMRKMATRCVRALRTLPRRWGRDSPSRPPGCWRRCGRWCSLSLLLSDKGRATGMYLKTL